MAFAEAIENYQNIQTLLEIAKYHPKFTACYVLDVAFDERLRRLKTRLNETSGASPTDKLLITNPEQSEIINAKIIQYSQVLFNAKVINATRMTTFQIINDIH